MKVYFEKNIQKLGNFNCYELEKDDMIRYITKLNYDSLAKEDKKLYHLCVTNQVTNIKIRDLVKFTEQHLLLHRISRSEYLSKLKNANRI